MPTADAPRPPTSRRPLTRALAAVVALALVLAGAYAVLAAAARDSFDVSDTYAGVRSIVVEDDSGNVELTGVPAGEPVRVDAHVTHGLSKPERRAVRGPDGALRLTARCPARFSGPCRVNYEIAVPAGTPVVVRAHAGNVRGVGLQSDREVRLASDAGTIDVRDIVAPAVALRTSAGSIRVSGTRAPALTATSAAGPIDVSTEEPPRELRAHSNAGSVVVRVPDAVYALEASTVAGRVLDEQVRRDPRSPRRISATSNAGNVLVEVRR